MHDAGIGSMVEATPTGLGRDVEAVARISATTGMHIVHVTGAHHSGHYGFGASLLGISESELTNLFCNDALDGFRQPGGRPALTPAGDPIRAGMVKAGIRYWAINDFERRSLNAAAQTHLTSGVPMMVHLDHGSVAHEVLDILTAADVTADQVVLAHWIATSTPACTPRSPTEARTWATTAWRATAKHRIPPSSPVSRRPLNQSLPMGESSLAATSPEHPDIGRTTDCPASTSSRRASSPELRERSGGRPHIGSPPPTPRSF